MNPMATASWCRTDGSSSRSPATSVSNAGLRLLSDQEVAVRLQAAQALRSIGPQAMPALETLLGLCKHEDPAMRSYALQAIAAIAPKDRRVHAALRHAESDEEREVRYGLQQALERVAEASAE